MPSQRIETPDGISWHIETFHPGQNPSADSSADSATDATAAAEYIVLIPSGEGDCGNLTRLAQLLSSRESDNYSVLTFDTPGFSRTRAPASAYARVTPQLLAQQIITLLDTMGIGRASFFGCSSGGGTTLALCAQHAARVKCGIVHEVPLDTPPGLAALQGLSDEEINAACEGLYGSGSTIIEQEINDGAAKWAALGAEYHARLARNYVPWVRGYVEAVEVGGREIAREPENLQRRPIFWTVGSLNPGVEKGEGIWASNFEMARQAGLQVDGERLRSLHFPAVTVPEEVAAWIHECVGKVKD